MNSIVSDNHSEGNNEKVLIMLSGNNIYRKKILDRLFGGGKKFWDG